MRALGRFLKTTALGGLFVLLPVLLLLVILEEVFQLLIALATPIADVVFPKRLLDALENPLLLAIVLLFAAAFLLGLAARSMRVRRLGLWLEARSLARIPLYRALKGLSVQLGEIEKSRMFRPVAVQSGEDELELAYLIEEHADGYATVLVPWSPTPLAGSVKIVRREKLRPLNTTLGELTRVLSHWGVGSEAMLKNARPQ